MKNPLIVLVVALLALTPLAARPDAAQAASPHQRAPVSCASLLITGPDVVAREYVTGRVLLVCSGRVRIEIESCIQVRLVIVWRNVRCMNPVVRTAASLSQTARAACRARGPQRTMRVWATVTISRAGQSSSDPGWSSPKRLLC